MTSLELRALDRRVAVEIMGDTYDAEANVWTATDGGTFSSHDGGPRRYSREMSAAWDVVEKLTEGEYVKVSCNTSHYHGDYCTVFAADERQRDATALVKRDVFAQSGETMPEAICKAALKATEKS